MPSTSAVIIKNEGCRQLNKASQHDDNVLCKRRQRRMNHFIVISLILTKGIKRSNSFSFPRHVIVQRNLPPRKFQPPSLVTIIPSTQINFFTSDNNDEEHDDPDVDDENDKEENRWYNWMSSGVQRRDGTRGVSEVKMRDPVELGGVPRSDRYSSEDWFHNIANLSQSRILKEVKSPVTFMTVWATAISILYQVSGAGSGIMRYMIVAPTCHSLMVSALGLLLVFRTNSAYQRFVEGRKIWENILSTSRDLSRMAKLYEVEIGYEKRRRVQALVAAFPYLLRHRIRPNLVMKPVSDTSTPRDPAHTLLLYDDAAKIDTDEEAASVATDEETTGMSRRKPRELYYVDKRTLPWRLLPPGAMEACARAQNRPLWVVDRLSKELCTVPDGPNFTNRERLALLSHADKLSKTIGACERIHQTVVPLNYARHALRTLTLWLLTLPFAIVEQLRLMTGPALFVMSWWLFGVYQIGTKIEDPFQGTLRLSILCDAIRRDVLGDELIRNTAFKLDTDVANEDDDDDDDNDVNDVDNKEEKIQMVNGNTKSLLR